jgi:hypothetical protein
MSKGIFTNKMHEPSKKEIFEALSSVKPLWDELISFIEDNYKITGEFKFYGKNFGWALRYRKSSRVLISMYPGDNEFMVQIILNCKEVEKALKLDLASGTEKIIEETTPIREGKWLYLKVTPDTDLTDIKNLISVRFPIKKINSTINQQI